MHNQKKKQQKPKFGDLSEFSAFLNTLSAPLAQPTKSVDDSANIKRRNEQLPDKTTITSTMAAVPVDAANKTPVVVHVRSKKGRKRALISELLQFQAVLRHPAFQSQPLSTIQQHIRNTASQIN
jgi:hypothetical protein